MKRPSMRFSVKDPPSYHHLHSIPVAESVLIRPGLARESRKRQGLSADRLDFFQKHVKTARRKFRSRHRLLDYIRTLTRRILWTSRLIFQAGQITVLVTT